MDAMKQHGCLEQLKDIVSPYLSHVFNPLDRCEFHCVLCSQYIHFLSDAEEILISFGNSRKYRFRYNRCFRRPWAHKQCHPDSLRIVDKLERGDPRSHVLTVRRAAQLVELGLPIDLAWPIAGAACWLFAN
jgi:hypothetical protein